MEPVSLSATGCSRMGMGVAAREVSMSDGLGTFTGCRRILRYLGYQLARATDPATIYPVAVNALVSHFVMGCPSRLATWNM